MSLATIHSYAFHDAGDSREPIVCLARLLDAGSLRVRPLDDGDGAGVRFARGTVDGAPVIAYCTDATRRGGALSADDAQRIVEAIGMALQEPCPVIGLWHSGGAKLTDGVGSMDGVGRMFAAMTSASGRVPQISVVLGPAAGAAAYGPALTDVIVMASSGKVFVTGPDVVRSVTGEQIDMEGLGGSDVHGRRSGVVHVTVASKAEAYARARSLTGAFARPGWPAGGGASEDRDLRALLPTSPRRAYDVRPLVHAILDTAIIDDSNGTSSYRDAFFEELQPRWAANIVVGLGRLGGGTVGVVANNPLRKGGCLDSLAAEKAARFVRMCDSFGIPLLVIVDVPGYLPGVDQEWGGVVRRGAKLLHAFAEAVVPRVTLITRKSYGGAYIAMNSRSLGANAVFAWPDAEVAVMGAEAAVGILHRKKLAAVPPEERAVLQARLAAEHQRIAGGVDRALALGVVDEVIRPEHTRRRIIDALACLPSTRGRHGNIPL